MTAWAVGNIRGGIQVQLHPCSLYSYLALLCCWSVCGYISTHKTESAVMAGVGLWVAVLAASLVAVAVNAQQGPKNPSPEPSFICEQAQKSNGALMTMGDVFTMLFMNYKHLNVSTETLRTIYMAYADDDRDNMLSKVECEKLLKHLNSEVQ